VSVSVVARWEPGGSLFTGNFKRYLEGSGKGASVPAGDLLGETWGWGSFSGGPKEYGDEGSGDGHHSPWGPHWGIWQGTGLSGT